METFIDMVALLPSRATYGGSVTGMFVHSAVLTLSPDVFYSTRHGYLNCTMRKFDIFTYPKFVTGDTQLPFLSHDALRCIQTLGLQP